MAIKRSIDDVRSKTGITGFHAIHLGDPNSRDSGGYGPGFLGTGPSLIDSAEVSGRQSLKRGTAYWNDTNIFQNVRASEGVPIVLAQANADVRMNAYC